MKDIVKKASGDWAFSVPIAFGKHLATLQLSHPATRRKKNRPFRERPGFDQHKYLARVCARHCVGSNCQDSK